MSSKSNPYIEKMLDISTAHVTEHDTELLNNDDTPIVAYKYEFGHFVCINDELTIKELLDYGYTQEFCTIVGIALENECSLIKLDGDGIIYQDLKTFEW